MAQLVHKAYYDLFLEAPPYELYLEYNRRLAPFNANISLRRKLLKVHMNLDWKKIEHEIQIGCIQHLLQKLFKVKEETTNIKLYNNFIKHAHLMAPKTHAEPILVASFERINELFFGNEMEQPNLLWGQEAYRKLAHYNFHNDSIVVSSAFKNAPERLLDFLMYHELLHKHFKFEHKNGRSSYHSTAFRNAEQLYPKFGTIELELNSFLRKQRRRSWF